MKSRIPVSFATKWLSNSQYLREVAVEGKECHQFFKRLTLYNLYVSQIIRTGNCITLLSNPMSVTVQSFWNPNHLEDMARYVFWTFNKGFLWTLTEQIVNLRQAVVKQCAEILHNNPLPYQISPEDTDQELHWCVVKNDSLQQSGKFSSMYELDQANRSAVLKALETRIASFSTTPRMVESTLPVEHAITFLDMLNTINGQTAEELLEIIKTKSTEAELGYDIFLPVQKLDNGKNPYGFNGRIAAVIDFFYQSNYFQSGYSLRQIFNAYLDYSGNTIGKLSSFLSEFREDSHYQKYFERLKALKINKLR